MNDTYKAPDLLLELVHKMQRQAVEYLQGNQGRKDFVSDIIYMLDGPEQRAAEAAHKSREDVLREAAARVAPKGEEPSVDPSNHGDTAELAAWHESDACAQSILSLIYQK